MSGHWLTKARKQELVQRGNSICAYCDSPVIFGANLLDGYTPKQTASLDHVIARNAGGDNSNENLVCSCLSCNASRKDTPIEEFVKDEERLYNIFAQALTPMSKPFRGKRGKNVQTHLQ